MSVRPVRLRLCVERWKTQLSVTDATASRATGLGYRASLRASLSIGNQRVTRRFRWVYFMDFKNKKQYVILIWKDDNIYFEPKSNKTSAIFCRHRQVQVTYIMIYGRAELRMSVGQ